MLNNLKSYHSRIVKVFVIVLIIHAPTGFAVAGIRLAGIFGDNMVLQRDKPVAIWGWSTSNSEIKIDFGGKMYSTAANAGKWLIRLDAMAAGGPYEMRVSSNEQQIVVKNVMIGEVWLCGGQSNMVLDFNSATVKAKYQKEIASSENSDIRQVIVNRTYSSSPAADCKTSGWRMAGPATLNSFSAAAYFFAKQLYEKYHVPIGLVNDCLGGTLAEAWTGESGLSDLTQFAAAEQLLKDTVELKEKIKNSKNAFDEWDKQIDKTDTGIIDNAFQTWATGQFDDTNWKTMKEPDYWGKQGFRNIFGSFWLRREVDLNEQWQRKTAVLNLGQLDDVDVTYFNGIEVGKGLNRDYKRQYTIPQSAIKAGKNIILIRITSYNGFGGMNPDNHMVIKGINDSVPLNGLWKYRIGINMPVKPNRYDPKNLPSSLYNAMIAPLADLEFKGVIWYQGEYNTHRAYEYRKLFPALINNWRTTFHKPQLPFFYVQLPNFQPVIYHPAENEWAELREAQLLTLAVPNTGMAVTIDAGGLDLHPANKKPVGDRLALLARKNVYGEKNLVAKSPIFKSMKTDNDKIVLTFDNDNSNLVAQGGGDLRYFAIAGDDKKFYWAKAVIKGKNTVEVSAASVPHPVAVRYAWAGNPDGCNLYNSAGLPASPFRTDSWPGLTINNLVDYTK